MPLELLGVKIYLYEHQQIEKLVGQLQTTLGTEHFAACAFEGQTMTLEEVIYSILGEIDLSPHSSSVGN